MAVSLKTETRSDHEAYTFEDDRDAGRAQYLIKINRYQWIGPNGQHGPLRECLAAARYDALAWAEDQEHARKTNLRK